MSTVLTEITDADFTATLCAADHPLLIEFYASHCAFCRTLERLLEDAAGDYAERVQIVRMDAENNVTRPQYGLSGVPTLVLYIDGKEQVTKTGGLHKQQLDAFLNAYV